MGILVVMSLGALRFLTARFQERTLMILALSEMVIGIVAAFDYPYSPSDFGAHIAMFVVCAIFLTMGYSFLIALMPTAFLNFVGDHGYRVRNPACSFCCAY